MNFAEKYGPWAVVAGASDGVGAAFAEALAERGVSVVLLARRQAVLDEVAAGIEARYGVQTRTLAVDLARPDVAAQITDATSDLEVGFVVFGSGAGSVGAPNMVAYGATKAFDMVFAEALWGELHDKGVDVLGLILGKTDTPALRRLGRELGTATGDEPPTDAATVDDVINEAFDNLGNGPTHLVGETLRAGMQMLTSLPRNDAVRLMTAASAASMGPGNS